jgi:hypothetical protein
MLKIFRSAGVAQGSQFFLHHHNHRNISDAGPSAGKEPSMKPTSYGTIQIDGPEQKMRKHCYCCTGSRRHRVCSSRFGTTHSDWPDPKKFAYTSDHYAERMRHIAEIAIRPRRKR